MRLCRLRPVLVALVAVALGAPTAPASAALVSWTFSGSLAWAEPGNSLGLLAGDPIAGHATFDESLVPPTGQFFLAVDEDPAFELAFSVGSFAFTALDDVDYGTGHPILVFEVGERIRPAGRTPFRRDCPADS